MKKETFELAMLLLILGLIIFLGVHTLPMFSKVRGNIAGRLGQPGYPIAYAIVSLVGLVLIVQGYGARWETGNGNVWSPPVWTQHVAALLMLPAMIAIAAAYVPSRIRNVLKHPMLVAIKIWAVAHLLANGDVASILLFGSFLVWAIADRISVKRRSALGPLGTSQGSLLGDAIVVAGGVSAYLLFMFQIHVWLFGVYPIAALAR
ncbi:MAG: NnrU family protein [Pseudomonadota bacterium]